MHEPPAEIGALLAAQASADGTPLVRDRVVELACRGGEDGHGYVVWSPSDGPLHLLVPKSAITGRA